MAIEREIWLNHLVEGLFADNSFVSKCVNHDAFVSGKTVHIPQAGADPNTEKNRTQFPATVTKRTDSLVNYNLDSFTTDPVLVPHLDSIQLSYPKRESVIGGVRRSSEKKVTESILFSWLSGKGADVKTSGSAEAAHTPAATGNRKGLVTADILKLETQFNKDDVPSSERYLLLDAVMYAQLLGSMTEKNLLMFQACADVARGVVGKLYSFEVMLRSTVGVAATGGSQKDISAEGAATDLACGLAWHKDSVCAAQGDHKSFASEDDPTYYGSIFSAEIVAGGSHFRGDKKGIVRIIQEAAS